MRKIAKILGFAVLAYIVTMVVLAVIPTLTS